MVKEWLSAGIAHVEVIVGPSKLMNEQSLIPLLSLIPVFWMVLCSSMLLVPFFWMIKFSGVLHKHKGEMMIVNSNGDENGALMVKGGAFVWKEWARLRFQCRGVIKLDFLIDWEGSMVYGVA